MPTKKQDKGFPLYLKIERGCNSYVHKSTLADMAHSVLFRPSRFWTVAGRVCSVQMQGGGVLKDVEKFTSHHNSKMSDEDNELMFREFLQEARDAGSFHPSSYSDVFHSAFISPRVRASVNALFLEDARGAWEEARAYGVIEGHWKKYDIRSAYLWASTLGLPDMRSVQTRRYSSIIGNRPGLYNVELDRRAVSEREDLPYPFNVSHTVNATTDEIDIYGLPINRIIGGVTWSDCLPEDAITSVVNRFSFAKEISKSYWGRWMATVQVKCHSKNGHHWKLANPIQNLVWAHLLIARVKMRCWHVAGKACHVYVDSVIVPTDLPVGDRLGDWRLDAQYENGIKVKRAGFYGPKDGDWDKTAGKARAG